MARLSFAEVCLLLPLVLALMLSAEAAAKRPKTLRRQKREWILPPAKLMENTDYSGKEFIAKIRSDKDKGQKVEYHLTGPGADRPPFNLFRVDPDTGFVRITAMLDREKCPFYNLTGKAKYRDGTTAEDDIPLMVTVLDKNDNPPEFELQYGNITETSITDTYVMQIVGKDADEDGTINAEIAYSIVSQEPEGTGHMFTLDQKTGKLYVKEPTLDRETFDFYKLVIKGTDMGGAAGGLEGTGTVEIKVLDINDNIPVLEKSEYNGAVDENVHDVIVMRIKALDADLEHSDNWLTVYTIAKGNEENLFSIETDKETNEGILKLIKPVDFEEIQKLELGLLIENVAPFTEGGAILMDVDVHVGEGGGGGGGGAGAGVGAGAGAGAGAGVGVGVGAGAGAGVGVGVGAGVDAGVDLGLDLGLDAGLEGGVDLGLDASLEGGVDLGLDASLEGGVDLGLDASLEGGLKPGVGVKPGVGPGVGVGLKPGVKPGPGKKPSAPAKSYPIKIAVNNVPEGPAFSPDTKHVPVSEDPKEAPEDGVIAVYTAIDPDTGKQAEDVSYAKAYDPDNWFTIDEETAEIKLNKVPDRESPFLVNGTYIAKILAITKDMPSKTATGTIAIQVTDSNDHCPTLTTTQSDLCSDKKTVHVTGFDEDVSPNAAPFTFRIIPEGTRGNWEVEVINATTSALHSRDALWPGTYELQVEVSDAQGLSCPANEVFKLAVCTCVETEGCGPRTGRQGTTSSKLAAPAIGLLLMAMCLLLFIPLLLLFCQCGGADTIFPDQFSDLPFDAKEHLISYHTEGKGEDKEVPLLSAPLTLGTQKKVESAAAASNFNTGLSNFKETRKTTRVYETLQGFQETGQSLMEVDNVYRSPRQSFNYGSSSTSFSRGTFRRQQTTDLYEDIALPDDYLDDYYSQKAACALPVKDGLLEYDYEGQGSPAGSVGCCSILESDNDLRFLNDLEPKFKTLAEICSPPKPTPKPSLTHKVTGAVKTTVDIVEPVVQHKIERSAETYHTDIKTEKVMSSTNISKSSISTVSAAPSSMTLPPRSKVTNISHTSNISHSATLPRQAQTVILQQQQQQQPIYYTTSPMLQPMHYVVQPQLQNTVLLADGAHGGNFQGLYVVSGPQSPSSGLVISGPQVSSSGLVINGPQVSSSGLVIQGFGSPKSPASPASPVSPTFLLPGSPGVSQGSVPAEGWKIIGPDPGGNFMLVMDDSGPGEAKGVDPGSSQGTLPRGAILVKEAAPPQGVLGPAAQGSVYGILPGHTVANGGGYVAVNSNLGQTWFGQPGQIGLGPVDVLGVGVGQPRMGLGHVVTVQPEVKQAGIWPAGMNPVGIRQVSVNQFQGIPPLEQTTQFKTFTIDSPIQEYPTQTSEKYSIVNLEEDIEKLLARPDVLQTSLEQSDTVVEELGDTIDDQLNKITEAPTNTFTDVISQTAESNDPQQNAEEEQSEQQENYVPSEGFSQEDISGSDVTFTQGEGDHINHINHINQIHDSTEQNMGRQEVSPLKEEEEEEEEEVEEEGKPVALCMVAGPEYRSADVEPQSNEVTEDQSNRAREEDVSPAEKVVSGLETNQVIATSDSIQAEENMEEMTTVTGDSQEEVKAEQEQLLDSEIGLSTAGDDLSATPPNESSTDTVNASEERSSTDQEAMPELQVDHSEGSEIVEGHANTDVADSESRTSLQTLSTVLTVQEEEGDLGDSNLKSALDEITTEVQVEGSAVPAVLTLEQHLHTAEDGSAGHKEEEDDDSQQNMSESGAGEDQVNADANSISDGEKEESIVEDGVSQQGFSTSDDQDTVNASEERSSADQEAMPELQVDHSEGSEIVEGHANTDVVDSEARTSLQTVSTVLTVQEEEGDLGDSNLKSALDEITTQVQVEGSAVPAVLTLEQHLHTAEDGSAGHKEEEDDDSQQNMSESGAGEDQVNADANSISDGENEESIVEDGVSQQGFSTSDDQDTERQYALTTEDDLISDDNINEEENDEEEMVQQNVSFSDDQDEESPKEDSSHTSSQVDDTLISDDNINVPEKEEEEETLEEAALSIQQHVSITDEESEGEDAPGTSYPVEEEGILTSETECLSEEDQVAAMSKVIETEVATRQVRQGVDSSQIGDITVDIPEGLDTAGQALVRGANMDGLDDVVTSSEELRSSRVATGQVPMSSEHKGASGSIVASGNVAEGKTIQSDYQNTDVIQIEQSEGGVLTLEKGKAEVPFDLEITEGLDTSATNASAQVSPTSYSEIEVVDETISSVLETDPGSAETGTASFIATSEVAEEAAYLVQNESVHMTGEVAGVGPNTLGKVGSTLLEVGSEAPNYMHEAEASGGEVNPAQLQTPRNKSRKSKKDKNPQSLKSPSEKCKQQ